MKGSSDNVNGDHKCSNLADVKFTSKHDSDAQPDELSVDPKAEDVPSISYFTLFRFASTKDKLCIAAALVCAAVGGCSTMANTLIFAAFVQSMVEFGAAALLPGAAGAAGAAGAGDALLAAAQTFALRNALVGGGVILLVYAASTLMNTSAYNQVFKIRQKYLEAALNQDFAYFDLHQTGDFAAKMTSDVVKLEEGIGEKVVSLVIFQAGFLSCVVMALVKGWRLALLCLVSFPATLLLVGVTGLIASRLGQREAAASARAAGVAEEALAALRTVLAFGGQRRELLRYSQHLEDVRRINVQKSMFIGLSMGTLFFCIYSSFALSFWFGYQFLINDPENYDVQTIIAVFFGVLNGSASFGVSTMLMEVFGAARGAGAAVFALLARRPAVDARADRGVRPAAARGELELRGVHFTYPSRPDVPVLKDVNLSVKKGQAVALVGHSGSGKSTVIQLIMRFYDVDSGSVLMDDHDVRELSPRWLRAQVGLVGQEPQLFNTTVRENIRYGRDDSTDQEIEEAARSANAHHFIMKLPKGYDTLVGERGASMSGGQKQRIAIARALVRDPRVLLLDEATSALDTESEARVQAALDRAQEGRTTIVVAHRLTTIRHVDVIYVFKEGRVIEVGNHNELMSRKGHYYGMVTLQSMPEDEAENKGIEKDSVTRTVSLAAEVDEEVEGVEEAPAEPVESSPSVWRVLALSRPEWRAVAAASACALLLGLAMPLLAVILGDFIGVLANPNVDEVIPEVRRYCLIFVGIGVASGVANFIVVLFYGMAGERLTLRLRQQMFARLLSLEPAFFDRRENGTGALGARLAGEAAAVQGATGQRIGTVLQAAGSFTFALALALHYEWRVGLVALSFAPLVVLVTYRQGRMATAESFGTAKTMQSSSKIAAEAVSSVRTVAALGGEPRTRAQYAAELAPALALARRAAHMRGLVFGLSIGIMNFVNAAALYYGCTLVVNEGISFEVVLKAAQALLMGASSSAQAFAFAPNFQKGLKAAGRIIELLNREPQIVDPLEPVVDNFRGSGEVSLQNVSFRYPSRPGARVLRGLSLQLARGRSVALVGPSGCGKTTVLQLLLRFYDPDEGIVAQDGVPVHRVRLHDARAALGLVQQEPALFDRSIADNIAYGDNTRAVAIHEVIDAAKQANIHDFVTSLPQGYDTNIGSRGTQLSGGQKQRVAIARALLRRPALLMLDEATSALDTESEKVVQEALDRAKAGRTCITIAHRLSTVRGCDEILVVRDGRVAERGAHADLMRLQGYYYRLVKQGQL